MKKFKINRRQRFRAVKSEVLPYELPIIYSNKGYNDFLQRYRVTFSEDRTMVSPIKERWLQELLSLLNGLTSEPKTSYIYKVFKKQKVQPNDFEPKNIEHVLDQVKIRHRLLTIPHPYYQFKVSCLYHRYSDYILYLSGRSKFSIRYPYKVGSFQAKIKDIQPKKVKRQERLEDEEQLKHYFAYKRYQNINGFYNDYKYQHAEKKFKYLIRTDLERCFDSISPEKMYQAVYGCGLTETDKGFAAEFVQLQKDMFAGCLRDVDGQEVLDRESKRGIPIGPEFSRIFAEIIIQGIDGKLEAKLLDQSKYFGKDYEFYRYVDDGFFFCNDLNLAQSFLKQYTEILAKWGLGINPNKIKTYYERPFLDELTIAKRRLILLVESMFTNRLETIHGVLKMSHDDYRDVPFFMESKYYIRDLQSIVKECKCPYSDITANLLSLVHNKLGKEVFMPFTKIYLEYFSAHETDNIDAEGINIYNRYEKGFINFCKELVSFLFFVFACDTRMSTSVKVMQIIIDLLDYVDGTVTVKSKNVKHFSYSLSYQLKKHICDELREMLITDSKIGIEKANLLLLYHRMPDELCLSQEKAESLIHIDEQMDFLTLFTLEHLIGRKYGDSSLQNFIREWIVLKLSHISNRNSAEYIYTLVNALSCPYFDGRFKYKICQGTGLHHARYMSLYSTRYAKIFIDWRSNKLLTMLKEKANSSVY